MTNKDFENLNDREFDMLLEDIIEVPSASDMPQDINPWRKAMNRVLWGTGLTTLTLNFLKLDMLLPAIGVVLLVLGYRTLRNENGWFKAAYIISAVRAVWFCISTFCQSTVLMEESGVATMTLYGRAVNGTWKKTDEKNKIEMTEAKATPIKPILNVNMKIGSKIKFNIFEITNINTGVLEFPSDCNVSQNTLVKIILNHLAR